MSKTSSDILNRWIGNFSGRQNEGINALQLWNSLK